MPAAKADLRDAYDYVAVDNPAAAQRLVERLGAAVRRLGRFTKLGRPGTIRGTREFSISGTPYKAVYRIEPDRIVVLNFIHTSRNWP